MQTAAHAPKYMYTHKNSQSLKFEWEKTPANIWTKKYLSLMLETSKSSSEKCSQHYRQAVLVQKHNSFPSEFACKETKLMTTQKRLNILSETLQYYWKQ